MNNMSSSNLSIIRNGSQTEMHYRIFSISLEQRASVFDPLLYASMFLMQFLFVGSYVKCIISSLDLLEYEKDFFFNLIE